MGLLCVMFHSLYWRPYFLVVLSLSSRMSRNLVRTPRSVVSLLTGLHINHMLEHRQHFCLCIKNRNGIFLLSTCTNIYNKSDLRHRTNTPPHSPVYTSSVNLFFFCLLSAALYLTPFLKSCLIASFLSQEIAQTSLLGQNAQRKANLVLNTQTQIHLTSLQWIKEPVVKWRTKSAKKDSEIFFKKGKYIYKIQTYCARKRLPL